MLIINQQKSLSFIKDRENADYTSSLGEGTAHTPSAHASSNEASAAFSVCAASSVQAVSRARRNVSAGCAPATEY